MNYVYVTSHTSSLSSAVFWRSNMRVVLRGYFANKLWAAAGLLAFSQRFEA